MVGIHSHLAPGSSESAQPPPASHAHPAPAQTGSSRPLRCFLVEDSPLILQNLAATLEEMIGAQVVGHAEDQATAMAWAQQHPGGCDLMVIDIFLKLGSGLEVLRQLRPREPAMHMVVLTNYATPEMRRRCLGLGADRVFDKSAELEELLAYCEAIATDGSDR